MDGKGKVNMKRIIVQCLLLIIFFIFSMECNARAEAYVTFDMDNNELTISGIGAKDDKFKNIVVCKSDVDKDMITEEAFNENNAFFLSLRINNGSYNEKVGVSEQYPYGIYKVHIEGESIVPEYIMFNPDMKDVVNEIYNSASAGAALKIMQANAEGLFLGNELELYGDYIAEYIFKQKEVGLSEFYKNYYSALVYLKIKNGTLTLKNAILTYNSFLSIDIDKINLQKLSETEQLLKLNDPKNCGFQKALTQSFILADINAAQSDKEIQKIFISDSEVLDTNLSVYNKISNSYYKLRVFNSLVNKGFQTVQDFNDAFYKSSQDCYKASINTETGLSGSDTKMSNSASLSVDISGKSDEYKEKYVSKSVFTDISGHWAEEYIVAMKNRGMVSGYEDDSFRPDNNISRAEFAMLIYRLIPEKNDNINAAFKDVKSNAWYYEAVNSLNSLNLVVGDGGLFRPDDQITREECAVIIDRMIENNGYSIENAELSFNDAESISEYAYNSVAKLYANKVICGDGNMFYPKREITRAEAIAMLERVVRKGFAGEKNI